MMVETYLRRGQRSLEQAALSPVVRRTAALAACTGGGFLLSAVGLRDLPQPVAMGLIISAAGWKAVLMSLGAMVGYPTFWGTAGCMGIVWSAAALALALMVNSRQESREQPLMLPVIAGFLTVVTGLGFRLILQEPVSWLQLPFQGLAACFSGILFIQGARCRDPVTDWLTQGLGILALGRIFRPAAYGAAGLLAVGGPFPAAALAGAALDLSGSTPLPMTAVLCIAWFLRLIPLDQKWKVLVMPAAAYFLVALALGSWSPEPLPGLVLGGALGYVLPCQPRLSHRRGEVGVAQVRLELSAEMLAGLRKRVLEIQPPAIDRQALLEKARSRACGGCALRRTCLQQRSFTTALLDNPLEADCRKQGRLVPELRRAREQLRILQADRQRQGEYREALAQQYQFLSTYLRSLSDTLPRRAERPGAAFRVEAAVRSREKENANGDRCLLFSGPECRYFLLLCDGMGTGLGAAREGQAAGKLLQQMLQSGFPAEYALQSLNSLLALGGNAGAVTVDLAEVALDTGIVHLYKWGAAPSWVLTRSGAEKIGTATPPPGIGVGSVRMAVVKLSLRRGEVLVLISDGVDEEAVPHMTGLNVDGPPGELAARLLEGGSADTQDDATAAVLRLRPAVVPTS